MKNKKIKQQKKKLKKEGNLDTVQMEAKMRTGSLYTQETKYSVEKTGREPY